MIKIKNNIEIKRKFHYIHKEYGYCQRVYPKNKDSICICLPAMTLTPYIWSKLESLAKIQIKIIV